MADDAVVTARLLLIVTRRHRIRQQPSSRRVAPHRVSYARLSREARMRAIDEVVEEGAQGRRPRRASFDLVRHDVAFVPVRPQYAVPDERIEHLIRVSAGGAHHLAQCLPIDAAECMGEHDGRRPRGRAEDEVVPCLIRWFADALAHDVPRHRSGRFAGDLRETKQERPQRIDGGEVGSSARCLCENFDGASGLRRLGR